MSSANPRRAAILLSMFGASCAGGAAVAPSGPAPQAATLSPPCKAAAETRAGARALFEQGKLWRAARALGEANRVCAETARETWDIELTAHAELGEEALAQEVAKAIDAAPDAPPEAKRALAEAKKIFDAPKDPTPSAKAAMAKLLGEADDLAARAADRGSLQASIDKYLAAWTALRPNGRALVGAGLAAAALSEPARARRFFDRAYAELGRPAALVEEHGLYGTMGQHVTFPDGRSVAIVHATQPFEVYIKAVSIVDTRTLRARHTLLGHTDTVVALAVSPDGGILATGSQDRTARLWDTRTGELLHTLGGHGLYVESISFSPDGKRVATGSHRESRLWDTATGKLLAMLQGAVAVAFSPNGKELATSTTEKSVALWDATNGTLLRKVPTKVPWIRHMAFSPDGARLAAAGYDEVEMWETERYTPVMFHRPKGSVFELRFSPDGAWLSADAQGKMPLWDVKTGKLVDTLDGAHVGFSPDGKLIGVESEGRVRLLDAPTRNVVRTLTGGRPWFLPNGNLLLAPFRGALERWDVAAGTRLARGPEERADQALPVALSPDGKHVATGLPDGSVRRWDIETGALLPAFEGHTRAVQVVAYSPDGALLATASSDTTVRVLDAKTGALVRAFPIDRTPLVSSVAFSPDGKLLAASARESVRVFDLATGATKHALDLLPDSASTVAFSPDGKFIASGSGPKVWHFSLVNGAVVRPMEGHSGRVRGLAYSPDGTTLATIAHDTTLRVWDEATGKLRRAIDLGTWTVRDVAFSPDGKLIATAGNGVSVWDAATGARVRTLQGHVGVVTSVVFSKDGRSIVSGGEHGSVLIHRQDGGRVALHAMAGEDAGYVLDLAGHVDFVGARACAARERLACGFGATRVPFEVCEDRARVRGLFAKALAQQPIEEPDGADLAPLPCAAKRPDPR